MERTFEVLRDGQWVPIEFSELKQNDTFRAHDCEILVLDADGKSEWLAVSDAYIHDDGGRKRWRIDREK